VTSRINADTNTNRYRALNRADADESGDAEQDRDGASTIQGRRLRSLPGMQDRYSRSAPSRSSVCGSVQMTQAA
jgi:hypothetical protein